MKLRSTYLQDIWDTLKDDSLQRSILGFPTVEVLKEVLEAADKFTDAVEKVEEPAGSAVFLTVGALLRHKLNRGVDLKELVHDQRVAGIAINDVYLGVFKDEPNLHILKETETTH